MSSNKSAFKEVITAVGVFIAAAPFYLDSVANDKLMSTFLFAAGLLVIIYAERLQKYMSKGKK